MKILRKVIPITTLTSVAVLAPMLTSCQNIEPKEVWDATWKIQDGLWKPTVSRLPEQGFDSEEQALNEYFAGIKKNLLLLPEDLISSRIIQGEMTSTFQTFDIISSKIVSYDSENKTVSFAFMVEGWDYVPFGMYGKQYMRLTIAANNIKLNATVESHSFVGGEAKNIIVIAPENNKTAVEETVDAWLNATEDWQVSVKMEFFRFADLEFGWNYNKQYIIDCQSGLHPSDSLGSMVAFFEKMPIYSNYLLNCHIN